MAKKKTQPKKWRLKDYRPIATLPAGKPLAPYRAPQIPAGKFENIEGQAVLDFGEDGDGDAT